MLTYKSITVFTACLPLLAAPQQEEPIPGTVRSQDLVLEHFAPKSTPASKLARAAFQLAGAQHYVISEFTHETIRVENIADFGDSVLLYDTPEAIVDLTLLLEKLDSAYDLESTKRDVTSIPVKHLSPNRVRAVLDNFFDGRWEFLKEQNTVLLRGSEQQTRRAQQLLTSLDRPMQQIQLSCYLICGSNDPDFKDDRVPEELSTHLATLLPYTAFELTSQAMLRTAVQPDRGTIELKLQPSVEEPPGVLQLSPGGFEPGSKTLTLEACSFGYGYGDAISTVFRTSTTVTAGEYTVLGATGLSPVFVVLRFELL